jgi:hypothetical protein
MSFDHKIWANILGRVSDRFDRGAAQSVDITTQDPLFKEIAEQVPWEVTKVYYAKLPKARKLTYTQLCSHRGMAGITNQGDLLLETEALSEVSFPRARFTTPMRCAIFF